MSKEQEWQVECILQRGRINNVVHYLVKWVGYPLEEATWQPITNLENCHHEILKFESSVKPHKKNSKKKGKKKVNFAEVFNNDTPIIVKADPSSRQSRQKDATHDPVYEALKEYQPKQPRMIELKPSSKQKMILDDNDDHEAFLAAINQGNRPAKNENTFDRLKQDPHTQQDTKKGGNIEESAPQVLQLFEARPMDPEVETVQAKQQTNVEEIVQKKIAVEQEIRSESNKEEKEPEQISSGRRKRRKAIQKLKKSKKSPIKVKPLENDEQAAQTCPQSPHVSLQTEKNSEGKVNESSADKSLQRQSSKSNENQIECAQKLVVQPQEIEVNKVEQFYCLLADERDIRCDQALKSFYRNTLLSVSQKDTQRQFDGSCPMLDLHDNPQALEQLGPVLIKKQPNLDLQVRSLARLRHGWIAIAYTSDGFCLAPVRALSQTSWKSAMGNDGKMNK